LSGQIISGFIVPNLELSGICHSQFKPGPPSEEAQSVSQFILDVVRNSKLLCPEDLVIVAGKLVWVVYIDLVRLF
jgi:exosome complex component RRP43